MTRSSPPPGSREPSSPVGMARFARWLVRYPVVFVAANLLVTAVLGVFALRIRIESSLESVLPAGDPEVEYYTRVRAPFGSDDVGVVGGGAHPRVVLGLGVTRGQHALERALDADAERE